MKKTLNKKKLALASSALLLAATVAGGTLTLPVSAASYANTYTVDVSKAFQEFDGWGLSLSWWATEIGDWTRTGSSGLTKREEVMEAIYGKSGLNLNIARYNVGGGDDPSHTHMTDDRNTPGWKGATKLGDGEEAPAGSFTGSTGGGEGVTYVPNDKYFFEDEEGNTLNWQDTPDWRQLWVLDWIQKHHEDDLLMEYYSNSPPYWMTKSGCTSGNNKDDHKNAKDDLGNNYTYNQNLPTDNNQAFVDYLLDVYEYLAEQGFELGNIQPFNESNNNYWYWYEKGDQEGCHFSSEQQVAITNLLAQGIKERGLDEKYGTTYNWGDETNTKYAWNAYEKGRKNNSQVVDGASRLTYHIYSYDNSTAQRLYRAAQERGQEIYMSEICFTEGSVYDPDAMATGFKYTQSILDTVKYDGVDGYVFWQGMEDMLGQMKSGTNYGLIQGVYYTQEEAATQGYDLAAMGYNHQDFVLSKAYYMSGQYTKYINKGYTIIDIDDNGSMAAISPDGQTLVVVKQNNSNNTDSFKLNLGGFKAGTVEKIVTDKTHNWSKSAISTDGSSIIDTVSASSVTTYVVHGTRTGGEGFYLDDSKAVKKSSLSDIQAAFAEDAKNEDTSKIYMYGTYEVQGNNGGDHGYIGTTDSGQNEMWMAIRFYGVGFAVPLPMKSDSGTASIWVDRDPSSEKANITKDLKSSKKIQRSLDNIVLSDEDVEGFQEGWHTIYVKAHSGGYVNLDGAFIKKTEDTPATGNSLAITQASGLGGTVNFSYEKVGFKGYEIFAQYRTEGGNWISSNESFAELVGSIDVGYASTVELRLMAVKGEDVQYSPAQVVNILEVKNGVLYFVDCGTASEGELSAGAVLGTYQSASDKAYGPDAITGLNWGYTNAIKTAYNGTEDAMTSVMSLDKTGDSALTYKFTIPQAGTYHLALGFYAGSTDWGTRAVTVSVTGATVEVDTDEVTLVGGSYNGWYATVETSAANTEITVSIAKASGDSPMVSLIVITDAETALPLYTSGASNYNSAAVVTGKQVSVGADLMSEVKKATATVYLSNGKTVEIAADGAGVSYTVSSPSIAAGQTATATITSEQYRGLEIYSVYTWHQEGARVLYYNIDCGFISGTPPDDSSELGIYQTTTMDRAYAEDKPGKSWGYTGSAGSLSYENNGSNEWSIRGNVDNLTYKMTGFKANEQLEIKTGGHLYKGWGTRAYNVVCNGTVAGNINFTGDDQDDHSTFVYETFNCTANGSGELEVKFTSSRGDAPWVGYIKVWSSGNNIKKAPALTADKTTVGRDGAVTLKNLEVGATVYVLDENGALLGNFEAEAATQTVSVIDYLPESSYTLRFTQAIAGDENTQRGVSDEVIVSVPGVRYTIENEYVKDGEELIIKFLPCIENEKGLTSFTVTPPGGVPYDLTEGFFFRAKTNGDYKVTLVANGVTSSQIVKITNFAEYNAVYSTEEWTADDVTLTLAPETVDEIVSVIINGVETAANAEGKYVITATRNGSYTVKLVTKAGYEYEKEFVISNIDKGGPDIDFNFNFSVSAGISFNFSSMSESGGKLCVSLNGGTAEEVTENGKLSLAQEGKYEFTYTNGAGQSVQAGVYYVTYGLKGANLSKVKMSSDGKISVKDKNATAKLYRAGEEKEITSMRADKMGKYYLELTNGSEKEIVVFNVDGSKSINGSAIMIAGIAVGAAAIVAAAAVCTVLILKGRKKS